MTKGQGDLSDKFDTAAEKQEDLDQHMDALCDMNEVVVQEVKEMKDEVSKVKEEVEAVKDKLLETGYFKDKVVLPKSDLKLVMRAAAGSPQAVAMVRGKVGMWNNEIDEGNAVTENKGDVTISDEGGSSLEDSKCQLHTFYDDEKYSASSKDE